MVTIQAPGVEINEIDLSQYDFPAPEEETTNVLIAGFAGKGHANIPYEFSNKDEAAQLIDTFGKPTTEAERYFFNACNEVISKDKTKLYAVRLPYAGANDATFNVLSGSVIPVPASDILSCISSYVTSADSTISGFATISCKATTIELDQLKKYRESEELPKDETFIIVDKNQWTYDLIPVDGAHRDISSRSVVGILPVITTAANAMFYQNLLSVGYNDESQISNFEPLSSINSLTLGEVSSEYVGVELNADKLVYPACSRALPEGNKKGFTLSKQAMQLFPTVNLMQDGSFDREYLKCIGIVVFKGFVDAENGNKVRFEPVESFVGELKKDAKNSVTGVSKFIDDIVNTNSNYIEVYSNCFNKTKTNVVSSEMPPQKAAYKKTDLSAQQPLTIKSTMMKSNMLFTAGASESSVEYDEFDMFCLNNLSGYSIGFVEDATNKKVSAKSIFDSLDKVFDKTKNINERQIDLVVDAGVANIAHYADKCDSAGNTIEYDPRNNVSSWVIFDKANNTSDVTTWQTVLQKYDAFCKKRGDCMFLADVLRPLVLKGNSKLVRANDADTTISKDISPYIKYVTGKIDTSYGAGYADWYKIIDPIAGVDIWMPPSVKAAGVYINTTNAKYYWTAPAGINNGKIAVKDIAFNPTVEEAADFYTKQWNYATWYNDEGFVIEGQKTFQARPTAFDRVNVRRLFLYLERKVALAARYFIYEGNTAYVRQRLIDTITPYFENAKIAGGLYDYRLQCDDKNNDENTIDHNELHVKVAIKPTKTIEFIEVTFIALRTGASFTEAGMAD